MLSLLAWCDCTNLDNKLSKSKLQLKAFAGLGGKYLGTVWLAHLPDLAETIKDLQVQGSLLLRHAKRTPNYMSLVLDGTKLPTLKYRPDMTQAEQDGVAQCFQNATSNSKIMLSWDEDDSEALKVLRLQHSFDTDGETYSIDICCPDNLPELDALTYLSEDQASMRFYGESKQRLLNLVPKTNLQSLELVNAVIDSWGFAKNLNSLILVDCTVATTSMLEAPKLKYLDLTSTNLAPCSLRCCTSLEDMSLDDDKSYYATTFYTTANVAIFRETLKHVNIRVAGT